MNEVEASVDIDAPPDVVWTVLTDFDRYSEWNPYLTEATGRAVEGETIAVRLAAQGGRSIRLEPRLLDVEPGALLRWRAHYLSQRQFDTTNTVELVPREDGTRVVQHQAFTGLATDRMFGAAAIEAGIQRMNRALKERTESLVVL
ncbi:SRPBCC domain-containing protein [Haloarchaeobius amylolyticus]|uniref:SRPBCC domain-containing protein n=1 Tax=Haloarchaeobius amylolyticus TaxID=1198296 RepID=UPI00227177FC|nr:SRPBCC domain-containing protein [Haloarchaeobius amylolyticus]